MKNIFVIFILLTGWMLYGCAMLEMNPTETGQISGTNIYAVKNVRGTVYFITTDNGYIMIDAGSDTKKIETSIKGAGIDANDVKWIFLTHSDYDHVASLPLFSNAEIYMSEDELPLINGTIKRSAVGRNKMPSGIDIDKIILLSNHQELSLGGIKVKCIKAPGHTNGSMLYLVDGKYLFTGDAFKIDNETIGVHPFSMDKILGKKTIEEMKEVINTSSIVLTSHYGYYKPNALLQYQK